MRGHDGLSMTTKVRKGLPAGMGPTVSIRHPGTPVAAMAAMSPPVVLDQFGLPATPIRSGYEVIYGLCLPGDAAHILGGQVDAWGILTGAGLPENPPPAPKCMSEEDKKIYEARLIRLQETKRADAAKLRRSRKGGIDMAKIIRIKTPNGGLSAQERRVWHASHAGGGYEHHIIQAKGYENLLLKMPPHLRHEHGAHLLAQRALHLEAAERQDDAPVKSASDTGTHSSTLPPRSSKKSRRTTMPYFDSLEKADLRRIPLGKLKNGKPLYRGLTNRRHSSFTPAEHREAVKVHEHLASQFDGLADKHAGTDKGSGMQIMAGVHRGEADNHRQHVRDKTGKSWSGDIDHVEDYLGKAENRRTPLAYLKNGKPIYYGKINRRHNNFTPAEHREASAIHVAAAKHHKKMAEDNPGGDHIRMAGINANMATHHTQMARDKAGKSMSFDWLGDDYDGLHKGENRRTPLAYLKNGKPIYYGKINRRHNNFTPAEHREAAAIHVAAAKHHKKMDGDDPGGDHIRMAGINANMATHHTQMARDKAGKSMSFDWLGDDYDGLHKGENRRTPLAYLKNGKPIYYGKINRRHNNFTPAEHREAAAIHVAAAKHHKQMAGENPGGDHIRMAGINANMATHHTQMARDKAGKSFDFGDNEDSFIKGLDSAIVTENRQDGPRNPKGDMHFGRMLGRKYGREMGETHKEGKSLKPIAEKIGHELKKRYPQLTSRDHKELALYHDQQHDRSGGEQYSYGHSAVRAIGHSYLAGSYNKSRDLVLEGKDIIIKSDMAQRIIEMAQTSPTESLSLLAKAQKKTSFSDEVSEGARREGRFSGRHNPKIDQTFINHIAKKHGPAFERLKESFGTSEQPKELARVGRAVAPDIKKRYPGLTSADHAELAAHHKQELRNHEGPFAHEKSGNGHFIALAGHKHLAGGYSGNRESVDI